MEKHQCSGYKRLATITDKLFAYSHKSYYKCTSNGTIFENGKYWCKRHAPSEVKLREEKKWQTYLNRLRRNLALNPTNKGINNEEL